VTTGTVSGKTECFLDPNEVLERQPPDILLTNYRMLDLLQRADARFRLSRWGAVGLSEWESVRFPPRTEIVKRCLDVGEGRVTVESAMDQVEAVYGQRPDRATLWGPVQQLGAKIVGDWIFMAVRESVAEPSQSPR